MDPTLLKFHAEHAWARKEGDLAVIGISDFAQSQLSDVTFLNLPRLGTRLNAGNCFGSIESAKALNELFAPLSGEVVAVNPEVEETPYLVNESPYERGWLIKIRVNDPTEWDSLLTHGEYESRCQQ